MQRLGGVWLIGWACSRAHDVCFYVNLLCNESVGVIIICHNNNNNNNSSNNNNSNNNSNNNMFLISIRVKYMIHGTRFTKHIIVCIQRDL
jgi:hypothetical protein